VLGLGGRNLNGEWEKEAVSYKGIKAIDARRDLQDAYVADMRRKMQKMVWQTSTCTAFYRRNMTEEVASLSPEPVTGFILSRKWFRLSDYRLLK
jgi:hypothetical protein